MLPLWDEKYVFKISILQIILEKTRTSNFQTKQETCILKRSEGEYKTIQIKAF